MHPNASYTCTQAMSATTSPAHPRRRVCHTWSRNHHTITHVRRAKCAHAADDDWHCPPCTTLPRPRCPYCSAHVVHTTSPPPPLHITRRHGSVSLPPCDGVLPQPWPATCSLHNAGPPLRRSALPLSRCRTRTCARTSAARDRRCCGYCGSPGPSAATGGPDVRGRTCSRRCASRDQPPGAAPCSSTRTRCTT